MYPLLSKSASGLFLAILMLLIPPVFSRKAFSATNISTSTSSNIDSNLLIAAMNLSSRPFAKSATFNTNVIEQMYRGNWVGGQWVSSDMYPGGLAGAIRIELSTGLPVGGVSHLQKGKDRLAQLKVIITNGKVGTDVLVTSDMDIARALHNDLLSALQTKP